MVEETTKQELGEIFDELIVKKLEDRVAGQERIIEDYLGEDSELVSLIDGLPKGPSIQDLKELLKDTLDVDLSEINEGIDGIKNTLDNYPQRIGNEINKFRFNEEDVKKITNAFPIDREDVDDIKRNIKDLVDNEGLIKKELVELKGFVTEYKKQCKHQNIIMVALMIEVLALLIIQIIH